MTHVAAVETEVFRELMNLVEVMATNATADGMPRTPMMVCVSTIGVAWIVEVIDRHNQVGFATMGLFLDAALEDANAMLRSGAAPWLPLKGKGVLAR